MAVQCHSKKCVKITLVLGIIILFSSAVMFLMFPSIYDHQMKKELALTEGSTLTKLWQDIPLPIYERIYFYNITNVDEFIEGAKMNLTEVGPYTYKSRWVKHNLQWHPNRTVTYQEKRTYHFVPEKSVGTEADVINTLNGPLLIAADRFKTKWWSFLLLFGLSVAGEHVVISKNVSQLVYNGYEDEIIKLAPGFIDNIPYKNGIFSWLYGKNNTFDGQFNVFTGEDELSKMGVIDKWNGNEKTSFWKNDSCNMLNGTSAEVGPPLTEVNDKAYTFFQSFFCRSLTFNYSGDYTTYGVMAKRYKPTFDVFANSSDNPDNYCFETRSTMLSGVQDLGPCQFNAPVYISFPHFYLGDPSYRQLVNALDPIEEDHTSSIDVEPRTGISTNIRIRFQINLHISESLNHLQFRKVRKGTYPVFWVEFEALLNEDIASFLKGKLNNPKYIAYSVLSFLTLLSIILIVVSIFKLWSPTKESHNDPLLKGCEAPDYGSTTTNPIVTKEPLAFQPPSQNQSLPNFHSVNSTSRENVQLTSSNSPYEKSKLQYHKNEDDVSLLNIE